VVFSILVGEDYVGNVWLWGIHPVHRQAELRIVMNPAFAGKGHGTAACRALLDFAFQQLNLNKVFLYVLQSNLAARRCFEKAGLRDEGVLKQEFFVDGHYVDAVRMAAWARK
jgi:diamine N-acetyltransferase